MFLQQPKDLIARAQRDAIEGPDDLPTSFSENVSAAFDYFRSEESSDSARRHWETQLNERADQIKKITGSVPDDYRFYYGLPFDEVIDATPQEAGLINHRSMRERARSSVEKLREQYPEIPTDDELRARIPIEAKRIRDRFEDISRRSEGSAGTFVGMLGGAAVDPLNLASMVVATPAIGAKSLGVLARTLRAAKIGAGTGAATETAIQPFVYDFKEQIGVEYSVGDALANIGTAGVAGGVLLGAGVNVPPLARASVRGMSDTYRQLVKKGDIAPSPESDAAARVVDTMADIAESNPLAKTVDGHEAHLKATGKALEDLADGRTADVADIIRGQEPSADLIGSRTLADNDPILVDTHTINSPERELLRTKIVDEIVGEAKGSKGQRPVAYIMGGGGASGKGTLLKRLRGVGEIPESGVVHIDPDNIKARIPEYKKILDKNDSRAAAIVHKESTLLSDRAQAAAIERGTSVVIDRTLGNPTKAMKMIESLKAAGYEVRLYGVTVDIDKAIKRAIARAEKSGRFVPIDELVMAHRGFAEGFDTYAQVADVVHLFDNSADIPLRIAEKTKGSVLEVKDQLRYNQFVERRQSDAKTETGTAKAGSGQSPADHEGRVGPERREGSRPGEVRQERQTRDGVLAGERLAPEASPSALTDDPLAKSLSDIERAEFDALITRLGDDFEIPVDLKVDPDGNVQPVMASARQLIVDIERKEGALAKIITCIGGAIGKTA